MAAGAALIAILAKAWPLRTGRPAGASRPGFGRAYWAVVAIEIVLIFGGRAVIVGPLHTPADLAPWLSLVVGVHFFAFVAL